MTFGLEKRTTTYCTYQFLKDFLFLGSDLLVRLTDECTLRGFFLGSMGSGSNKDRARMGNIRNADSDTLDDYGRQ